MTKNLPVIRAKDACTAVRSERGACTAESGSATMAGARTVVGFCRMLWGLEHLLCGCGSVTSTVEAPTGAMLLLFASQACCAVVVLRWAIILRYARGTYTLSKWTNACCRHGKKSIRDRKFVA